jgi:type II secretory pathway pseudopilin PulG
MMDRVEAALARRFANKTDQKGTLLLDSLIAMAIIAIIFAVAYPNYSYARQQSQVASVAQQLNAISTAIAMYSNDNSGLNPLTSQIVAPALFGGAANNYFTSTPLDPSNQANYNYVYQPAAGAVPATYILSDPTAYAKTLLGSYQNKTGAPCAATCAYLNYNPIIGVYGSVAAGG